MSAVNINEFIKYDLYSIFLMNKNNFNINTLRKSYQRQILIYHPDKIDSNLTEEEKKDKYDAFLLINNAYTILSNDDARKSYDKLRELTDAEERNFVNLKTQYKNDVLNKVSLDGKAPATQTQASESFKQKMDELNKQKEEFATSGSISANLNKFKSQRDRDNKEIVNFWNEFKSDDKHKEEIDEFLRAQKVQPPVNFKGELSNINVSRNVKIEQTDKEYDGLVNDISSSRYASLDDAFSML
jgi:curved DNA-binding protein CbpA